MHEKLETLQPPGPHDVHVGTRITSYIEAQMGIRLTMSRWTEVVTSVTMSMCGEVKTRDNRSGWVTVSEQCNHILMLPRWVRETPGPGEAQVRTET